MSSGGVLHVSGDVEVSGSGFAALVIMALISHKVTRREGIEINEGADEGGRQTR